MIGGCAIKTILIKLIRATFRAAHVTVECSQFNFRLWPFNRCSFQQTTSEQRLHHSKAYCGRSGHAVPVHEAHQRHLGAGWAKGADGEPKLHGEYHELCYCWAVQWRLEFGIWPYCLGCAMLLSLSALLLGPSSPLACSVKARLPTSVVCS